MALVDNVSIVHWRVVWKYPSIDMFVSCIFDVADQYAAQRKRNVHAHAGRLPYPLDTTKLVAFICRLTSRFARNRAVKPIPSTTLVGPVLAQ